MADEAADGVALSDAAHKRLAEPLPMFSVDVTDYVHSDFPPRGDEGGGVSPLDRCMPPSLLGLMRIVTDRGQGAVVHRGNELARDCLGQHIEPNRRGREVALRQWFHLHQRFHRSSHETDVSVIAMYNTASRGCQGVCRGDGGRRRQLTCPATSSMPAVATRR